MVNTRSQQGNTVDNREATTSTADQIVRNTTTFPPPLQNVVEIEQEPVLTGVTAEARVMEKMMKVMTEAMNRQQEAFMKMLENRIISLQQQDHVNENIGNKSGYAEVAVVTEETLITREKEKEVGCSYKTFLSCKPPEFTGTTDPVKCIYWIKEIETALDASDCVDSQKVKFASRMLKGEALAWWDLIRSSLTPGILAKMSWSAFKEKILKKYCSKRSLEKIEDEFRNLRKGDSLVSHYAKLFLEKLSLVEHVAPNEPAKIRAYLKGLPAEMRTAMRNSKADTIHDAIEESMRIEDDISDTRNEQQLAREKKRKREEATEQYHSSKTPKEEERRESSRSPKRCHKCQSRHHGSCHRKSPSGTTNQSDPISCNVCGKQGHLTRDCSIRGLVCYECKEPGHFKKNCPKLLKGQPM